MTTLSRAVGHRWGAGRAVLTGSAEGLQRARMPMCGYLYAQFLANARQRRGLKSWSRVARVRTGSHAGFDRHSRRMDFC